MNARERMLKAFAGEKTDRLPVLCINQTATYEQMEKLGVNWPDAHFDSQKMAALAEGAYSILGFDVVRVPFCQTIEAEALGCALKDGGQKNLPSVGSHPYKTDNCPAMPANYKELGRIKVVADALKILKDKVGNDVCVVGGIVGPFSITGSLLGVTAVLRDSFRKPQNLQPFMELGVEAGLQFAEELLKAGADAICIEDMMASLDMISPKIYRELIAPYHTKLVSAIKAIRDVPVVMHICGRLDDVIEDIGKTGVNGISCEEKVDAPKAIENLKNVDHHVCLMGGVNAAQTLFSGNPDKVREEVVKAINDGYHMIAPSCSIPPATPLECLKVMLEEVEKAAK